MSAENVAVARAIMAAWHRRESARPWLADGVEFVNPPHAVEPGTREGIEAFQHAIAGFTDAWDVDIIAKRFEDFGEEVLIAVTLRTRGRLSGVESEAHQGWVWTIRDGKGVRFRWFRSTEDALAAVRQSRADQM